MAEAAEKKADDAHASAPEADEEPKLLGASPDGERILEQDEIDSLLGLAKGEDDDETGIQALLH